METTGREHRFTEKVLNLRSTAHQFGKREIRKARVLGRDQIRHDIGDPAIVFRGQQALGAKQVVVQKSASGNAPHTSVKNRSISLSFKAPQQGREIWNVRKPAL